MKKLKTSHKMGKLLLALVLQASFSTAASANEVLESAHVISSSKFSELLFNAYVEEGAPTESGFVFADILACEKVNETYSCSLLPLQWQTPTEPTFLNGVMFELVVGESENDPSFDLFEYMRAPVTMVERDGMIVASKLVETTDEKTKRYSAVSCVQITEKKTGQSHPAQCLIYDNLVQ